MNNQLARRNDGQFSLVPRDFGEAMEFARLMASSDMVPKDYKGKPANVIVAVQMGQELGLNPMQALQNIAVINGRPCLWGDAVLAIVKSHPKCRGVLETYDEQQQAATCVIKRQGNPDTVATFGVEDAKAAGLWGKQGPWTQYPKRMLKMRARSFACRDAFPDALRGISSAEEMADVVDAKTGEVTARPATYFDAEIVEHKTGDDGAATETETADGDGTNVQVDEQEVSELLRIIADAATKDDITAIRDRIRALPRGSRERADIINAGVAKTQELEQIEQAERDAERHASATHEDNGVTY